MGCKVTVRRSIFIEEGGRVSFPPMGWLVQSPAHALRTRKVHGLFSLTAVSMSPIDFLEDDSSQFDSMSYVTLGLIARKVRANAYNPSDSV